MSRQRWNQTIKEITNIDAFPRTLRNTRRYILIKNNTPHQRIKYLLGDESYDSTNRFTNFRKELDLYFNE